MKRHVCVRMCVCECVSRNSPGHDTWESRHVGAWSANSRIVVGGPAECLKTRVVIWVQEEEIYGRIRMKRRTQIDRGKRQTDKKTDRVRES